MKQQIFAYMFSSLTHILELTHSLSQDNTLSFVYLAAWGMRCLRERGNEFFHYKILKPSVVVEYEGKRLNIFLYFLYPAVGGNCSLRWTACCWRDP